MTTDGRKRLGQVKLVLKTESVPEIFGHVKVDRQKKWTGAFGEHENNNKRTSRRKYNK